MHAKAAALAAGRRHSVGRIRDGTVVAVGDGASDECQVGLWVDIVSVAAGNVHTASNTGRSHSVGLRSDGRVVATGWNGDKQCDVTSWRDVVAVAAGWRRTLGLLADGTVLAAGRGAEAQCDVQSWRSPAATGTRSHSVRTGQHWPWETTAENSAPLASGTTSRTLPPVIFIPSAFGATAGSSLPGSGLRVRARSAIGRT
jgi:alpha-tubulin suppressor-like RCC1 family protein